MKSIPKLSVALLFACFAGLCSAQKIAKVTLSAAAIQGGSAVTGTLDLGVKVDKTPVVVTLTSTSTAITLPASATVAVGQSTATFPIATTPVPADVAVTIKATVGKSTASASFNLQSPRLSEFTFSPASAQGGTTATGIIKINSPAPPGGVKIVLTSNTSLWKGPPSCQIQAGSTTTNFALTTEPVVGVTDMNVLAALGGSKIMANMNLTPAQFTSFRLTNPSVVGGTKTTGLLLLNGPAPKEGFKVRVSCDSRLVKMPLYVTIPAGQNSATFNVDTKAVTKSSTIRITAGGAGAWVELSLEITPAIITKTGG